MKVNKFDVDNIVRVKGYETLYRITGHGYGDELDYVYSCRDISNRQDGINTDYYVVEQDLELVCESVNDLTSLPAFDEVNKPKHYNQGKYEVIDIIEDITRDMTGVEAVCVANIVKYIARYRNKNGITDVKKAIWYANKLVDVLKEREETEC